MDQKNNITSKEISYSGIPVSEGVIIGKVLKLNKGPNPIKKRVIDSKKVQQEISRFEDAILQTRKQILDIQDRIAQAMGKDHANIFNAHLLLIEDFTIIKEVNQKIKSEKFNAEYIFSNVMERFIKVFSQMEDEYLRERVTDIKDVTRRVISNLVGNKTLDLMNFENDEDVIIVAYDLSPSETALMHKDFVVGFATDIGGKTSHTAIMARSLGIPAVVGLHDVSSQLSNGTQIILDGTKGLLIANPSKSTLKKYFDRKSVIEHYEKQLSELKDKDAVTLDGIEIQLNSNIELNQDVEAVIDHGSDGIGLYRTEFCYMNRSDLPDEEELYSMYSEVVTRMEGKPVVIRTMDIGGDKFLCHMKLPEEINPFLGWRAIRFCLERVDIFKTQIKAILRSSVHGDVRILFPMISNLTEVLQAKFIIEQCKNELKNSGKEFDDKMKIGVMIEIPGAALAADFIADHVDFFSIGTNDLIQYTLAVDRVNEKIAYLYQPLHPAVFRLIHNVVQVGKKKNISVSLCGEMSSDPHSILLLIGMGLNNFSLSPYGIPRIKKIIRSLSFQDCQELLKNVSTCATAEEIRSLVNPMIKEIIPEF